MHEQDRVKLLFGPYLAPKCRIGGWLTCRIRGKIRVVAMSAGPIPWPMTRRESGGGPLSIILCGDLVKAVKQESETAVMHHWRIGRCTVWSWRKALGVGHTTAGTSDLRRRWAPDTVQGAEAREQLAGAMRDPEREAKRAGKIAAARRGKPRPAHVLEALRKANVGRRASEETRRKMSEAHLSGVNSWAPEEEELLGTMPDKEVAERTGRSVGAVGKHRVALGIPSVRP